MRKDNIKKAIAKMSADAKRFGVILNVKEDTFYDDDHLDAVWYGGEIGSMTYKGYELHFSVQGEVRITGELHGRPFSYENRENTGALALTASDTLDEAFANDGELKEALDNGDIRYEENNWIELFTKMPDGYWREGVVVDDADSVLEALNISEWVDFIQSEYMGEWACTDPDSMQFRRLAPEKGAGVYELAQVNQYGNDLFHVAHGFVYLSDIDADEQGRLSSEYGWDEETLKSDDFPGLLAEASFESAATEYDTDAKYASFEDAARAVGDLIGVNVEYLKE